MALLSPLGPQFFKNDGTVAAGCRLYTFQSGTTTQQNAFTDQAGATPHTYVSDGAGKTYIALDSAGKVQPHLWLTAGVEYRIRLNDSFGSLIDEWDDVYGVGDLSAPIADENITLQRSESGSVATTLQVVNQQRPWSLVADSGAAGDGVADDAAEVQAAITSAAGKVIDGNGLTYKCNSVLTGIASGTTLQNMTLDFSGISTASARYMSATGTKGTAVSLTSNLAVDAVTVAVGSTATFAAEQWAWLESTAIYATVDSTVYGQMVKVKSVDSGTQLTLYAGPFLPFNTAASASISPITPVTGVKFKNVKIIGSGANSQGAIRIDYGLDCHVDKTCTITDTDYFGVFLYRCINTHAAPTVLRARAVGLAYGIAIGGGCLGCAVDGGYGEDLRHYVTVGDNDGVNMHCRATNNVVMYSTSAGIDSHAASFDFIAEGNQITLANGAGAEGVTLQGLNNQAIGNTVRNVTGVGIFMQPLVTATGLKTKAVARGNHIHLASNVSGTPIGVYFQNADTNGSDFEGGDMDGNFVYGGTGSTGSIHFYIIADKASATLKNINVRGNVSVDDAISQCLYIRALDTSTVIENVTVTGNNFKTSGARCVYVLATGTSSEINNVAITGNVISGGTAGNISIIGNSGAVDKVVESGNVLINGSFTHDVSGTVTNLTLKSAEEGAALTVTSSTDSAEAFTNTYIFNVGSTCTFTLPGAAEYPGRILRLRTIQAQAVNSASSNVIPRVGGAAGTAILAATDGAWCDLFSNGTNWEIIRSS